MAARPTLSEQTPPQVKKTVIDVVAWRHIPAVHQLFVQAVRQHFGYFDEAVQNQVIHDHRPLKLALAKVHKRRLVLSAHYGGELVGYAIGAVPTGGHGQIYWLYVDPSRRGKNTGLALLSRMLKLQRALGAYEISLATHDHRRYYERQGFSWREAELVNGVRMDIMTFRLGA